MLLDDELADKFCDGARPLLFTMDERHIGSIDSEVSLSELRDRPLFTIVERRIGSVDLDVSLSSRGFVFADIRWLGLEAFDGIRDGSDGR
jgi:hypothetical protein